MISNQLIKIFGKILIRLLDFLMFFCDRFMSKYNILHMTRYQYASPVSNSANQVILFPKTEGNQEVLEQKLTIVPATNIDYFNDYFNNKIGMFTVVEPHQELIIRSELKVETHVVEILQSPLPISDQWADLALRSLEYPYLDFVQVEKFRYSKEVTDVIYGLISKEQSVFDVVDTLSNFIHTSFQYKQGVTTVETQLDEIWEAKMGVCQDFAHMLIAMLRIVGVPARYVSGYICPSNIEMRGEGATHAWVEAYIPEIGWLGNDPTNNCWVNDKHIKIAYGRDFKDCTPVKGTYEGTSNHNLYVSVVITGDDGSKSRIHEEEELTVTYVSMVDESANRESQINSYQKFIQQQQQQQ